MLEIRHFQLIKNIAETGSMTQAARKLFLTQPSLSHQLKEIESRLGAPLFLRVNKTMVLTRQGKKVLEAANDILPKVSRIEREILGEHDDVRSLRVTTQCYTCYHWLPSLMKKFRTQFPSVEIDVVTEAMSQPVQYLLKGDVDIAITNSVSPINGVRFEKLFEDEQVALVPAKHPLALKKFLQPSDFANQHMIIYKEELSSDFFAQNMLIPRGIKVAKVTKMQLTEARVELVKAGMGLAVLSRWLVKPFVRESNAIRLIPIGKNGFYRSWHLVTLEQLRDDPAVQQFATFLKEQQIGNPAA